MALRTLLRNLIDNAVRYTRRRRPRRCGGGAGERAGRRPRLVVSDDGPGIAAAERARVFDRFYRRAGNSTSGSGLGLAIVKSIADAHGAAVELTDNPPGPRAARGGGIPAAGRGQRFTRRELITAPY